MSKKENKTSKCTSKIPQACETVSVNFSKEARRCILKKLEKDPSKENFKLICEIYGISAYRLKKWQEMEDNDETQKDYIKKALTDQQEEDFEKFLLNKCVEKKREIKLLQMSGIALEYFSDNDSFRASTHWARRFRKARDIQRKMIQVLMDNGLIEKQQYELKMMQLIAREENHMDKIEQKMSQLNQKYKENQIKVQKIKVKSKKDIDQKEQNLNNQIALNNKNDTKQTNSKKSSPKIESTSEDHQITIPQSDPESKSQQFQNPQQIQKAQVQKDPGNKKQTNPAEDQIIFVKAEANPQPEKKNFDLTRKYSLQEIEKLYKAAQDQLMLAQQQFIQIQTAFYKLKIEQ